MVIRGLDLWNLWDIPRFPIPFREANKSQDLMLHFLGITLFRPPDRILNFQVLEM